MLAKRPELLGRLRGEETNVWPGLCQRMEMGEIEAFALRLRAWADEGSFAQLRRYAEGLIEQVDNFDVDRLPKSLRDFPSVCRSLEGEQPQNS